MGTQTDLRTIAAGSARGNARPYDTAEPTGRPGITTAIGALVLGGTAVLRKLLWGDATVSAAPSAGFEPPDVVQAALPPEPSAAQLSDDEVAARGWKPYPDHPAAAGGRVQLSRASGWQEDDAPTPGIGLAGRGLHLTPVNDNGGNNFGAVVPPRGSHLLDGTLGSAAAHPDPALGHAGDAPPSGRGTEGQNGGSAAGNGDTPTGGTATGGTPPSPSNGGGADTTGGAGNPAANVGGGGSATTRTNAAPIVSRRVTLPDLVVNHALLIGLTDLLQHATDADGDTLSITDLASSSGQLNYNGDNTWTFTAALDDESDVSFSYAVTDGEASVAQTAVLDLVPALGPSCGVTVAGTELDDTIIGTPCADQIDGGGGHDLIYADAGNDILYGGAGNDTILGGDGDDVIHAGSGDDVVFAGAGSDIVFGGDGNDTILGGDGNDAIDGGDGNDVVAGEGGNDMVTGGTGDDTFIAGGGVRPATSPDSKDVAETHEAEFAAVQQSVDAETAAPDAAPATLAVADDTIDPSVIACAAPPTPDESASEATSQSVVTAAELMPAGEDDGDDVYIGGAGIDTLDLSRVTTATVVDLGTGTAVGAGIGHDLVVDVENVIGGSGADTIIDSASRNVITGGDGDDVFAFRALDDTPSDADHADQITDFDHGDKIDVSRIDAFKDWDEKQEFEFLGEIKSDIEEILEVGTLGFKFASSDDGEHTHLYGRTTDAADYDFLVDILGRYDLTPEDFQGLR